MYARGCWLGDPPSHTGFGVQNVQACLLDVTAATMFAAEAAAEVAGEGAVSLRRYWIESRRTRRGARAVRFSKRQTRFLDLVRRNSGVCVQRHRPKQHIVQSRGWRMIGASNGLPETLSSATCTPAVFTTVWKLRQRTRRSGRGGGNDPVVPLPHMWAYVDHTNKKDVITRSLAHHVRSQVGIVGCAIVRPRATCRCWRGV
jgi:hypothetical protein